MRPLRTSPRSVSSSDGGWAQHLRLATPGWSAPTGWPAPSATTTGCSSSRRRRDDAPGAAWREFCLRQADAVVLVARGGDRACPRRPVTGPGPAPRPRAARRERRRRTQRVAWVGGHRRLAAHRRRRRPRGRAASRGRPARRPVARAGAGRRRGSRLRPRRRAARARGRRPARRPRGRQQHRGDHRRACTPPGMDGETLEEVCYAEFVRRRPFSDYHLSGRSLARGSPGARCDGAPLRRRHRARGAAAPALRRQRRPGEPHPAGAPARPPRRRHPRLGPLPVLFAPIARDDGRLLVDGGVLDNLPTDLLVERDEGPGRGRHDRVGRRRPAPPGRRRGCPGWPTP